MYKLSILTVVKDDLGGLFATLSSLQKLHNRALAFDLPISIQVIVKDGSSPPLSTIDALHADFSSLNLQYMVGADNGIYDAMNNAFMESTGDYITFLNAGDVIIVENYLHAYCSLFSNLPDTIVYGHTDWHSERSPGIPTKLDRMIGIRPILGRLPNHQAMLIPREIQAQLGFDLSFPISADKDFKIRAAKYFKYSKVDYCLVESRAGGRSQTIENVSRLFSRSHELHCLMHKNYGFLQAILYSFIFFVWNSRKLLRFT